MDIETLRRKYEPLSPLLTERTRRLWAAAEAEAIGHGGIAMVYRATGISRARIARGIQELRIEQPLEFENASLKELPHPTDPRPYTLAGGAG